MPPLEKNLPSTALVPFLASFSYQLKRDKRNYNFQGIPTYNSIVAKTGMGYAFARASFPTYGATDLEMAIHNLSLMMASTFTANQQAIEYQWSQIDSLVEVILQNQRTVDILTAQEEGACALLGEECSFYVNESGHVKQELKVIKDNINLLKDIGHNAGLLDHFDIFGWLPFRLGAILR